MNVQVGALQVVGSLRGVLKRWASACVLESRGMYLISDERKERQAGLKLDGQLCVSSGRSKAKVVQNIKCCIYKRAMAFGESS